MAHDVFISYADDNRSVADSVCKNLEGSGIRCWVAHRDIQPGRNWPGEIHRAIAASKVMVLVFSSHANRSEFVKIELERAVCGKVSIVPICCEQIEPCDEINFFIRRIHWLNAIPPRSIDNIAPRLVEVVAGLLGGKERQEDPISGMTEPPPQTQHLRLGCLGPRHRAAIRAVVVVIALLVVLGSSLIFLEKEVVEVAITDLHEVINSHVFVHQSMNKINPDARYLICGVVVKELEVSGGEIRLKASIVLRVKWKPWTSYKCESTVLCIPVAKEGKLLFQLGKNSEAMAKPSHVEPVTEDHAQCVVDYIAAESIRQSSIPMADVKSMGKYADVISSIQFRDERVFARAKIIRAMLK